MSLLIKHAHHLTQLMSTKISENTNIQLDLKTVVAIIMVTASFVGMYYTLQADIADAKKEYFQNKTQMQTEAVDNDLLKEQNPSMPISQRRNSSVSYGKKKATE